MTEDRSVPRYPEKELCKKCGGRRYVRDFMKNGDTSTTLCPDCVPPISRNEIKDRNNG